MLLLLFLVVIFSFLVIVLRTTLLFSLIQVWLLGFLVAFLVLIKTFDGSLSDLFNLDGLLSLVLTRLSSFLAVLVTVVFLLPFRALVLIIVLLLPLLVFLVLSKNFLLAPPSGARGLFKSKNHLL